jgi:N-hydroxyarylamine O-acetyltransferase
LDGATVRQGGWTYGTRRRADGTWALRDLSDGDAPDLYAFTEEAQHRVDYVIANHFTATHPSSPFVGQAVAIRTTPDVRHTLRGLTLTTTRAGSTPHERMIDPERLGEVLRETFGIALGEDEITRIRDRAVEGMDTIR